MFFFNSTLVVDILISLSLYAETCVLHETARTGESLIKLHNASMSHPPRLQMAVIYGRLQEEA
jgi:hypothetical protein